MAAHHHQTRALVIVLQRALQYNDEGAGLVMMGGHEAESQPFRASEAAIRGFWKHYRSLMGE